MCSWSEPPPIEMAPRLNVLLAVAESKGSWCLEPGTMAALYHEKTVTYVSLSLPSKMSKSHPEGQRAETLPAPTAHRMNCSRLLSVGGETSGRLAFTTNQEESLGAGGITTPQPPLTVGQIPSSSEELFRALCDAENSGQFSKQNLVNAHRGPSQGAPGWIAGPAPPSKVGSPPRSVLTWPCGAVKEQQ